MPDGATHRPTVGSLFTGIGGFDLGFERAGFRIAWQCEIDGFCQKVLRKHWPEVRLYDDVREITRETAIRTDVIIGGFPCQPHSLAGLRKGSEDERDLWGEFARVIGELKPKWVVAENVRGLLSSENGWFFGRVLRDLAHMGYDVEWGMLRASDVGAQHQRERIFIMAYSTSKHGNVLQSRICQKVTEEIIWSAQSGRSFNNIFGQTEPEPERTIYEPRVGRVAHGIPNRVDRLRALGNAVVPQVAEVVARAIMETYHAER